MSDFDKEAEREKLREKFERDRQKRAQSERMSELLLKGATMTNKHHDCGSPIFRWQDEEFCPSCEGPNGAGGQANERRSATRPDPGEPEAAESAASSPTPTDGDESADAAADAAGGSANAVDAPGEVSDSTGIDVAAEPSTNDGTGADADPTPTREPTRPPRSGRTDRTSRATDEGTADEGAASNEAVEAAGASIERTLADLAREAEETPSTDLSRKRNLVAATREAAEALEAIRRTASQ